jgi:GrpB-like predicted nucleotidyltransferase (UPF0157 family)/predicted ester cyclase
MGPLADPDPAVIEGVEPSVQIVLAEYDPSWADRFEELRQRIGDALGADALRIEHIGSTSVPGLTAKPIIDILLVVAHVDDDDAFLPRLVDAGFVLRRREPDHRLLRTPARDVHIHVFSAGAQEIRDYLDFRDWLRVDEVSRKRYEAVKRELARLPWRDGNQYAIAKTAIVSDLLRQGREWRCERHKAVVRRLFDEVWNGRHLDALDELYAPDYVADYRPYGPLRHGPEGVREMVDGVWATFPDYHEELLSMVADGWRVAVHLRTSGTQLGAWGPLPATGKRLEFEEMILFEFDESGRVVHQRGIVDNLLGLRQAGVIPSPEPRS